MSATGNKNVFGEAHETHTNGFDLDELWPALSDSRVQDQHFA